jgi:hypothetical protein
VLRTTVVGPFGVDEAGGVVGNAAVAVGKAGVASGMAVGAVVGGSVRAVAAVGAGIGVLTVGGAAVEHPASTRPTKNETNLPMVNRFIAQPHSGDQSMDDPPPND